MHKFADPIREARMNIFGAHGYYRPQVGAEDPGRPREGAHHFEWRLAYVL
jgi:6-phosphogluconate dehydrogenase